MYISLSNNQLIKFSEDIDNTCTYIIWRPQLQLFMGKTILKADICNMRAIKDKR